MLTNNEREQLIDRFDVYDLVEILDLSAGEIIDAFDTLIEGNAKLMEALIIE